MLMAGIFLIGGVVAFLYRRGYSGPVYPEALHLMRTLSVMNIAMFAGTWALGPIMRRRLLPGRAPGAPEALRPAENIMAARWMAGRIMVLAPREGSAFVGLVACQLGVLNGSIYTHPVYWANLFSAVIMVLYAAATFPSQKEFDRGLRGE